MMYNARFHKSYLILALCLIALFSAACAGGSAGTDSASGETAQQRAVPTMPPARFTAVAAQQGSALITVTVSSDAAPTTAVSANLERGAGIYARLCESCHGAAGEGVADEGGSIQEMALTLSEFDTLLRTGGQGSLGPTHLFGPSALSGSGLEALYAYVQSLGE